MAQVSNEDQFVRGFPYLSPNQQDLLLAALSTKNRQNAKANSYPPVGQSPGNLFGNGIDNEQNAPNGINPSQLDVQDAQNFNSPNNHRATFGDNMLPPEFLNDDADFGDIDLTQAGLDINDDFSFINPHDSDEHGDKRKSPEEDDDEDEEEGGGKRQEGEDKVSKKPGRKPLTTEPTTKRKAQNRAAQRAFRERKEKHLKDLESKVTDLEKASESANHENGLLRAQVTRLQSELRDYRKRLSVNSTNASRSPNSGFMAYQERGANVADFQFDFPTFGNLPSSSIFTNGNFAGPNSQSSNSFSQNNSSSGHGSSPINQSNGSSNMQSPQNMFTNGITTASPRSQKSSIDGLENLFSPSILSSVGKKSIDYGFPSGDSPINAPISAPSNKSFSLRHYSSSQSASNTASPSASSVSAINGPTSSCGTSPEPMNSPATKTNGPEAGGNNSTEASKNQTSTPSAGKTPGSDLSSFDWLASQNGGTFDPVLFGDYRESQDAIIGDGGFSGGFFEDTYPTSDFDAAFNFNTTTDQTIPANRPNPTSLLDQIEKEKNCDSKDDDLVVPGDNEKDFMTCHKIWNQLQNCPRFQEGNFDIDALCTELQAKAKCSETGVVVPKDDVRKALWKLAKGNVPAQPSNPMGGWGAAMAKGIKAESSSPTGH